ncbi:MAG TPA: hypothetical protein VFX45_12205 [Solirubrobacterales bacterium]|nr:hypothetical protein [Solirubrobacterales bacterium]
MRRLKTVCISALTWSLLASVTAGASGAPTGEYAQFKACPLRLAAVNDCVYSLTDDGSFTIGKRTVPIKNPLVLQGGFEGEEDRIRFFGAENGETLVKSPQPVPGGLTGVSAPGWWPSFLQEWFNQEIGSGHTQVKATVELTGPNSGLTDIQLNTENLLNQKGLALGLPVKFHLESPLLGSNCYIGWESNPVQLDFTTGSDGNLQGVSGESTFNKQFTITTIADGKLVNNSFKAPRAEGCGGIYSFFIDPLINSILGVPSGSGKNSAIFEGKLQDALAEYVKKASG